MLRRLGSFGVCRPLLRTFYETVVASVVSYAVVCWGGGCSERDKKRLNRLIKRASSVCGCPLDSIEVMGERRALAKLSTIIDNTSPPSASDCGGLKQLLQQQTQKSTAVTSERQQQAKMAAVTRSSFSVFRRLLTQQYRRRCFQLQNFRGGRALQPLSFRCDGTLQMFSSRTLHTAAGESRPAETKTLVQIWSRSLCLLVPAVRPGRDAVTMATCQIKVSLTVVGCFMTQQFVRFRGSAGFIELFNMNSRRSTVRVLQSFKVLMSTGNDEEVVMVMTMMVKK
ncbi:hypothetical protein L3Q82_008101 [Scortum barcoo]|uniref:Uncharacterized protein n=1 Tax=Scortum barcoo TaxID=214431 RepID=A0ACB8WL45_9TELE|nr:hypothetical protein L3Q82_008101 [Scortum barcoo]